MNRNLFSRAYALLCLVLMAGFWVWAIRRPVSAPLSAIPPYTNSHLLPDSVVAPPFYLLINGERWNVDAYDFHDFPPGTEGVTYCDKRIINYKPITDKARIREDMWHEIVHAGFCKKQSTADANWAGFMNGLPEHNAVYALGMFLPGFVHDNPEFMKWAENW